MKMGDVAKRKLVRFGSKKKAKILQKFFKTGPGEYGEGDVFLGVKVPDIRKVANNFKDLNFSQTCQLLKSKIHEERLLALLIFTSKYKRANALERKKIYNLYLRHTKYINNWDLVDLTAGHIVGHFLSGKPKTPLYGLAKSSLLWDRRISIVSTYHFIKNHEFDWTLKIAQALLNDDEDLIHKACGWMLREVGKRNIKVEESFLKKYYKSIPRTMLRYAIEKFPENKRKAYLKGGVI